MKSLKEALVTNEEMGMFCATPELSYLVSALRSKPRP